MGELARLRVFVLLGALLLFGLEPLVGRLLLPSCGGGFHVWAACLLFFQGALFLGYLYCHLGAPRVGRWHALFVLAPLAFLPIGHALHEIQPDPSAPTASIMRALTVWIGVPFVLLSTTGVIAQGWLAKSTLPQRDNPYQLYAASNIGSFVALLAYPIVVEPLLGLTHQRYVWSGAFLLYVLLALSLIPRAAAGAGPEAAPAEPAPPVDAEPLEVAAPEVAAPGVAEPEGSSALPAGATLEPDSAAAQPVGPGLLVGWVALAAVPSACLIAVTNVIALDLGSLPMVWVVPLCVYLLSFVLTFGPTERYPFFLRRFTGEVLTFGVLLWGLGGEFTWLAGLAHLGVLAWVCWVGHGELYRSRPDPSRLTTFYLAVSFGGWVGGILVTFVAPRVFTGLYEYPLALVSLALTLALLRRRELGAYLRAARPLGVGASLVLVSLGLSYLAFDRFTSPVATEAYRNEYGIYRVGTVPLRSLDGQRVHLGGKPANMVAMSHGTIIHGKEPVEAPGYPIGYFHPSSPLGLAVALRPPNQKVAIVGLGAGAMACNLRAGDELTFYELDPLVEVLARRHFHFLEATPATLRPTRTGDARLELSKDPEESYDVILVDAFTSDAIPIHLLTAEALALYRARLKPGGWLVLHISSRYYDLRPVVRATARSLDEPLAGAILEHLDPALLAPMEDPSSAFVLARTSAELEPLLRSGWVDQERAALPAASPWSDDYANVLGPLWARWERERAGR